MRRSAVKTSRFAVVAIAVLSVFGASTTMIACGPPAAPKTVSLRVAGEPAEARVRIDENYIGNLSAVIAHGVALPPGTHRVTVEAPGYFPWDKLVEAHEGDAPIHLDVKLLRVPE